MNQDTVSRQITAFVLGISLALDQITLVYTDIQYSNMQYKFNLQCLAFLIHGEFLTECNHFKYL